MTMVTTYRFDELVDVGQLQDLMDRFHAATGIPVGIIDVAGTVQVATGWQEICTAFHRVHPVTLERCRQSDRACRGFSLVMRMNFE